MNCLTHRQTMRSAHLFLLLTFTFLLQVNAQPVPLWRAHAHNDYEHQRPLQEALARGFGSIEVDIHLVDGELLVAHDLEDVDPERTIEKLYLAPLHKHIMAHRGQVYSDPSPLILLVDIKTGAEATYTVLRDLLARYQNILTRFEGAEVTAGAVTVIISGNRPRETMAHESVRWAAYDGRLEDLGKSNPEPVSFIPLISSNWMQVARWYGHGTLSTQARKKLERLVTQAHAEGRKIRFWATSDNPRVWEVLYTAGVDYLNADDLAGLQAFLLEKKRKEILN